MRVTLYASDTHKEVETLCGLDCKILRELQDSMHTQRGRDTQKEIGTHTKRLRHKKRDKDTHKEIVTQKEIETHKKN